MLTIDQLASLCYHANDLR
uniref:Uncharacterized protein n=1 Tax=Arundo donax TaxID=35708 RepID=A0A0A9BM94_ARUDO